jgi:hypothetical protein
MWSPDIDGEWAGLTAEILVEMKAWRAGHPDATLDEIEQEVDRRMAAARARPLAATATASASAAGGAEPGGRGVPPCCPECGAGMRWEGVHRRRLTTTHNRDVTLTRRYARCPRCGTGLFPPG